MFQVQDGYGVKVKVEGMGSITVAWSADLSTVATVWVLLESGYLYA